ncbi:receptor kinase-like protein Xa21 [Musa acuminata AAA Group]|uniref:receptor kinase-like protein Xa21 n=1 Tax=Musa acuminata AAA Group TaxID=214697 RepID=UPI0031D14E50
MAAQATPITALVLLNTRMEIKRRSSVIGSCSFLLVLLLSGVGFSASQPETAAAEATTDRLALLSFKALISDDPSRALESWNTTSLHFCRWRGVTCGNHSGQLRVTTLELESLALAGKISPSIANLTFLQRLHLPQNQLEGPVPQELGLLSRLQHLNLSYNSFRGTVPTTIANLSSLILLDLSYNQLVGSIPHNLSSELQYINLSNNTLGGGIPDNLRSLSKLKLLALSGNNLTGNIPPEIGSLVNLTVLDLSINNLEESIPLEIGNLISLKAVYLDYNKFTGAIPASIGNLTSLIWLQLSQNQLTGAIPRSLSHCSELQYIFLGNNMLEGEIPSDISSLSNLKVLYLWNNRLTGSIPPEIGNLTNLTHLNLYSNRLEGSVPREIGNLVGLREVLLNDNQLTGSIPSEIGNLVNLRTLALLINGFVGTVPPAIGNLTSLTYLGLSINNLGGIIPPSIWNLSSLRTLELQSNHFTGSIPPDMGITLPLLEELDINDNQFYGPLPISLSNATNLNNIQLYENRFTGTIPRGLGSLQQLFHFDVTLNQLEARNAAEWGFLDDLANCSSLKYLQLTSNNLSGFLPQSIANFSNSLMWFEIDDNNIAGSIPAEIGNLVSLTSVRMKSNLLTGGIPAALGSLAKLQIIDLSGNRFTGDIPATLGNLTELTELQLYSNRLQGPIPPTLGNCPLELLDLSFNQLNGTVPKEIMSIPTLTRFLNVSYNSLAGSLTPQVGNMKNIGQFDISGNRLSGTIPRTLGDCQQLDSLDMAGNSFQGSIPSSFSQLKGLQSLDLSRNNLSGLIPEFLGNFRFLSYLNLSFNNLEGELPKHGIFTNLTAFSVLGNSKLCGGVQALNLPPCPTPSSSKRHLSRKLVAAISVAGGIICLILLLSLFGIHRWMPKSKKEAHADGIKVPHMMVTYAELLRATNGFSSANLVGVGSFGSVYKGLLNYEEYQLVAVKVLNLQQRGASRSFVAECEALRNVRHRNLVKILTACTSTDYRGNDFKALLYEFMPNGSLEKWVHPEANEQGQTRALSLIHRLNILIDVASALDYLHHHGPEPIVHCDIKPSNVLLDHDMVAHVGDFGLARFLNSNPVEASQRSSTSMIFKGSIGYVAPEYGVANKISVEGDVYSYGILVLETLTGKRPTGETLKDDLSLPRYLEMALPERVAEIIDPNLLLEEGEEPNECTRDRAMECLALSLKIGIRCTKESPPERMLLVDAVNELTAIRNAYLELSKQGRRTQLRDEDPVLD